ncbi:dihydrolipoamide acetyltransferase family protein [Flavobacterium sp. LB1P71]|uniref:dihydrolipoamide acetyltransferase family protein n=1 Tax=unclassified Flavobacterium TaxID=196869 RepID=UPI003AAF4FD3
MIEFLMPSLGADMEEATLIEWKKKPGDTVKRGDIIAEVETQKELIDIEIFEEGTIGELLIKEGDKVPVGTVMALINPSEVTSEPKKEEKIPESIPIQSTEERIESIDAPKVEDLSIKTAPLAQRISEDNDPPKITETDKAITKDDVDNPIEKIKADDNHNDLSKITATATDEAITKDDVDNPIEKIDIENTEEIPIETEKQSSIAEAIRSEVVAAMSQSNREIPHYYLEKRIDMTNALAWLQVANNKRLQKQRLLPVALLIKATAKSLLEFPDLNAIWDNGLQLKKDINIGFVVSLRTGGIIVPALHQANLKSIDEIMDALNDIIPRARALRLLSSELSDSTITLTSIGDGGADTVFGVVYPPQVAIIGFGSISEQPFAENEMIGIRSCVSVTLAGDHRATDGLTGSRFLVTLNKYLQIPEAL